MPLSFLCNQGKAKEELGWPLLSKCLFQTEPSLGSLCRFVLQEQTEVSPQTPGMCHRFWSAVTCKEGKCSTRDLSIYYSWKSLIRLLCGCGGARRALLSPLSADHSPYRTAVQAGWYELRLDSVCSATSSQFMKTSPALHLHFPSLCRCTELSICRLF